MIGIFFSSRRRHTRYWRDWSSDVCSSDLRLVRSVVTGLKGLRAKSVGPFELIEIDESGTWHPAFFMSEGTRRDRKSVVEGKIVDLGGRRIIKKKMKDTQTGVLPRIVLKRV